MQLYNNTLFPQKHNLTLVFVDPMKLPLTSEAGIESRAAKKKVLGSNIAEEEVLWIIQFTSYGLI